jgi:hypothetical protein
MNKFFINQTQVICVQANNRTRSKVQNILAPQEVQDQGEEEQIKQ